MGLRLDTITREFGSQRALEGVSLHVRPGDCYGFIGHNGAGKTTAMRIALGLIPPTSGKVLVDGFDAARHPREARARMGALVEMPGFYGRWSGSKNLSILARLQGLPANEARREVGRLLDVVGLANVEEKPVQAYSQGMRQRLGIAQALIGHPPYILLDEPTNGLDPEGIAEMRSLLKRLTRDEGVTVMLSSHQLQEIAGLCNRIGVLRQGRLLLEEEMDRLLGTASGRYRLVTPGMEQAREVLAAKGISSRLSDGELDVDLGDTPPARATQVLVEGGIEVMAFAPRVPMLEDIYLECGDAKPAPQVDPTVTLSPPTERQAPSLPILRMMRYEMTRLFARATLPMAMLVPVLLSALAVWQRMMEHEAHREQVANEGLISTTDVTAFESMAVALDSALWIMAVTLCLLCSQAIAGEHSRGTLRNILLRPVRRWQVAAGKILTALIVAAVTYAVVVGAAFWFSAWAFDFQDQVELLPNGATFPLVAAEDVWPDLWHALKVSFLPVMSWCGIGFLAGSCARGSVGAFVGALGAVLGLEVGRTVARNLGAEAYLPSPYLPSPLGENTSYFAYYGDVAQGVSNASLKYSDTMITVPAIWAVAAFGLAVVLVRRRLVP